MAGVNKVILVGHVGRDPELRHTQGGKAVANFSLATSEEWGGQDGQEKQEHTEWHELVVWGRQAEIAKQYIRKGRQLFVEGKIQKREWTAEDGGKRHKTEVVVRMFQMLGRRNDDTSNTGSGHDPAGNRDRSAGESQVDDDLGPPLDIDDNPLSPGV